jgi:hypothetical protein
MRLHVPFVASTLSTCVLPLLAWAQAPPVGMSGWTVDVRSGCSLKIDAPVAGGEVNWTGACVNGLAEGSGVLTTTTGNRYEGRFRMGMREGHGVMTYLNGNRFEGEWRANKPNGIGTYNQAGHLFTGVWKNGCFDHKGQRAVVASTAHDCGFDD